MLSLTVWERVTSLSSQGIRSIWPRLKAAEGPKRWAASPPARRFRPQLRTAELGVNGPELLPALWAAPLGRQLSGLKP
jgi:hypothetical protein